jgi:hypothetical protein
MEKAEVLNHFATVREPRAILGLPVSARSAYRGQAREVSGQLRRSGDSRGKGRICMIERVFPVGKK